MIGVLIQASSAREAVEQIIQAEHAGVAGLRHWLADGMGEVLAHPLLDPADRQGSLSRALAAIARAASQGA